MYYRYLDSGHSHAVTAVSDGWRYDYDPNGNLLRKVYRPGLYFPLVLLTEPEEALGAPPESQLSRPPPTRRQKSKAGLNLLGWLPGCTAPGTSWASFRQRERKLPWPPDCSRTPPASDPTPDPNPPEAPEEIEYTYDA